MNQYLAIILRYVVEELWFRTSTQSHFHFIDPKGDTAVGRTHRFPGIQQAHSIGEVVLWALWRSFSLWRVKSGQNV